MIKLTDTQAVLLSAAAQRESGSLLPLPTSLKPGGGANKALDALIKHGLAEARATADAGSTWRTDGDRRTGLFLTPTGAAAVGIVLPEPQQPCEGDDGTPVTTTSRPPRKAALVLDLLRRPAGATLAELIELTGWLPHTTRAALTGLRKKGHEVTRGKRDGVTFYVVEAK